MSLAEPDAPVRVAKKPFIRAYETWILSPDRRRLVLAEGLYGDMAEFEAVSRDISFGHDEGLPGKAWAKGRPIILNDLGSPYFRRGAEAARAGLTCGVALPIFSGDFLMGVLVMFCGDDPEQIGAAELWRLPQGEAQMRLEEGYFGQADSFEFSARNSVFGKGVGLPGKAWETDAPVLLRDLGRSKMFLRRDDAANVGLSSGIAIPCGRDGEQPCALAFLSALNSPLARRVELWERVGPDLLLTQGFCTVSGDAAALYQHPERKVHAGAVGAAWRAGAPVIARDLRAEPPHLAGALTGAGFSAMIAVPVLRGGRCRSALAFYV